MKRAGKAGRGSAIVMVAMTFLLPGCASKVMWRPDLGGAMDLAAREERIVIVAYWSTFNKDCMEMDRTVFRSDRVVETLGGTVPVRLDATWNQAWAREVGITKIPSFVAFAPDGSLLRRHEGFLDEPAFRGFVVAAKLSQ